MPFIPVYHRRRIATWARVSPEDEHLSAFRWRLTTSGYAVRGVETIAMHRQILGLVDVDWTRVADHINGNPLDNRRSNLRIVTQAQNTHNRVPLGGSSRHMGVCWNGQKNRWRARVTIAGRVYRLGDFIDEAEAAAAVRTFRATHMPFSREARLARTAA